jgi:hypothetical protein
MYSVSGVSSTSVSDSGCHYTGGLITFFNFDISDELFFRVLDIKWINVALHILEQTTLWHIIQF